MVKVVDANATILRIAAHLQQLGHCFQKGDDTYRYNTEQAEEAILDALWVLVDLALGLGYGLKEVVQEKHKINCAKYPVDWCLRFVGKPLPKYPAAAQQTGIRSDSDTSIVDRLTRVDRLIRNSESGEHDAQAMRYNFWNHRLELMDMTRSFAEERKRLEDYTHHSLALSMWSEYGELCTVLQWNKPQDDVTHRQKDKLLLEVADVAIYLLHAFRMVQADRSTITDNSSLAHGA